MVIIEVVSDDIFSTIIDFELKVLNVFFPALGFDMSLGISCCTYTKIVPRPDELDQVRCMWQALRVRLEIFLIVRLISTYSKDILDPFGGSESVYARCASQIYTNLVGILEKL